MHALLRLSFVILFCGVIACWAADVPPQRLQTTTPNQSNQSLYYWKATPVGNTAQLLTLFSGCCQIETGNGAQAQPLVSILRDKLSTDSPESDRVVYVWLLSYSHLNFGQRVLSAVPFFYWRVGGGSKTVRAGDTAPLLDLNSPGHPVTLELERDILQWTTFDPMITPVRATSRAYRSNEIAYERVHLEETISYLRRAPVSQDDSALTRTQLDTVIARLEFRKRLLGGLVTETRIARLGEQYDFEQERIRSRNWELLRQCAERTGLLFEPLDLAGTTGEYAIVWFPLHQSTPPTGTSLRSIWKLLDIQNPWSDDRLTNWRGLVYLRSLDENGGLLPADDKSSRQIQIVPLAVYSLRYPKLPLLLLDFRSKLHVRWHEMTQRSINEVTAGVIGISHFTNWYYYVAADLYDFVANRHGAAMNEAARLDCYSQFRVALALDHQIDFSLKKEMQHRMDSLALNPLDAEQGRELEAAAARYRRLDTEAENGTLMKLLDKERRSELAAFEESKKARVMEDVLHDATLGSYTHRSKPDPANVSTLNSYRRIEYHLHFLDSLAEQGTQPEVVYDPDRIQASVSQLSNLMLRVNPPGIRTHAAATLESLRQLSRDESLQADCSMALIALKRHSTSVRASAGSGIAAVRRDVLATSSGGPTSIK